MSKFDGKGLLGVKVGMTSIFSETGDQIPVTVVRAGPNAVLAKNELPGDGGVNLRVGFEERKESRVNKPELGVFKKAGVAPTRWVREFRCKAADLEGVEVGSNLDVNLFQVGQHLDVTGTSKGKGFTGVVKRYKMGGNWPRGSHGAHEVHRHIGSIGQRKTPGRVFPGKRMAGHAGTERVTVRNLEVIGVDAERNLLLLRGAVPGAKEGLLMLRPAVRAPKPPNPEASMGKKKK